MSTRKTHDAVYVEKYTTPSGEEKKRYTNIGSLLQRDDGSILMKLESIPVNFSGWIALYEPREKGEEQPVKAQPKKSAQTVQHDGFEDSSIPF